MGTPWTEKGFIAELERLGETEVRVRLEGGRYDTPQDQQYQIAKKWLLSKERSQIAEAQRRNDASRTEELAIASSARDAAWESARAAKGANTRSIAAIIVALLALLVAAANALIDYSKP